MKPIALDELVEAIGSDPTQGSWYLNLQTGTLHQIPHAHLNAVLQGQMSKNDARHAPESVLIALDVVADDGRKFLKLPGQLDVLEWDVMRRFAESITDKKVANELGESMQTASAFRDFHKSIRSIEKDWVAFRRKAYERIAMQWCEEHNVSYH